MSVQAREGLEAPPIAERDAAAELERLRARNRELEDRLQELESAPVQMESYAEDLSRTYGELRRSLQRMTILHEANTSIASALDPDAVSSSMLDALDQLINYDLAAIYTLDLDVLATQEAPNILLPASRQLRMRRGRSRVDALKPPREGTRARSGGVVDESVRDGQRAVRGGTDGSLQMAVPLRAVNRTLGALFIRCAAALSEEEIKLVELLASGGAVALQNAHLHQETQRLATTDSLTGLSNRRHFEELFRLEVERARRLDYPIGFMMMDFDNFRQVNARHLHAGGDLALFRLAEVLRTKLRRTDVVGRLGGEEFGAVLPGANLEEVGIVAEKVRSAIADMPSLPVPGTRGDPPVPVTISVGGTSMPGALADLRTLLNQADQALYRAKDLGKNRIEFWEPAVAPPPSIPYRARGRRRASRDA